MHSFYAAQQKYRRVSKFATQKQSLVNRQQNSQVPHTSQLRSISKLSSKLNKFQQGCYVVQTFNRQNIDAAIRVEGDRVCNVFHLSFLERFAIVQKIKSKSLWNCATGLILGLIFNHATRKLFTS
jgi:hypothetical protein